MKKNIIILFLLVITAFSFTNFKKKPLQFTEHKRHFTAKGDINFDLSDTSLVMFLRVNLQGKSMLSLVGSDSSLSPLSIVMIDLKRKGVYGLIQGEDSCSSMITYSTGHNASDIDIYMSMNAHDESGFVKIDSLSDTYVSGSYKTTISNLSGTSLTASGIFAGDFYDQHKTDSLMKAQKLVNF